MAKRRKKNTPQLPHILVEAIKDQRAVVVLGAGSSKESNDVSDKSPPDGNQLRDHLAKKFLGAEGDERDLATVAEMAIANGAGQTMVFEEIANLLRGFEPSDAHQK